MPNVLAPDGSVYDIPADQLQAAQKAGGQLVTRVQAPDTKALHWIPDESLKDAQAAGGLVIPEMQRPGVSMQESAAGYFQSGTPDPNQEKKASDTRMSAVAGLTGLPTPNMNEAQRADFEKGKAAGAVSNVATVAGGAATPVSAQVLPMLAASPGARWLAGHLLKGTITAEILHQLLKRSGH